MNESEEQKKVKCSCSFRCQGFVRSKFTYTHDFAHPMIFTLFLFFFLFAKSFPADTGIYLFSFSVSLSLSSAVSVTLTHSVLSFQFVTRHHWATSFSFLKYHILFSSTSHWIYCTFQSMLLSMCKQCQ